jgi:hypothetical protein
MHAGAAAALQAAASRQACAEGTIGLIIVAASLAFIRNRIPWALRR